MFKRIQCHLLSMNVNESVLLIRMHVVLIYRHSYPHVLRLGSCCHNYRESPNISRSDRISSPYIASNCINVLFRKNHGSRNRCLRHKWHGLVVLYAMPGSSMILKLSGHLISRPSRSKEEFVS